MKEIPLYKPVARGLLAKGWRVRLIYLWTRGEYICFIPAMAGICMAAAEWQGLKKIREQVKYKATAFSFMIFSLLMGYKYVLRCLMYPFLKEGIKRLLTPINISRCFELPNAFNELCCSDGQNYYILDLSSPKLLAFYIAKKTNSRVVATDIAEREVVSWRTLWDIIDNNRTFISSEKLHLQVLDGRQTAFKDETFDRIVSVSVLEHIDADGDTVTVKELSRILKKNGILVLTLPYSHEYYEEYKDYDIYGLYNPSSKKYFWSRYYNDHALLSRLIEPSGLELIRKQYVIENPISFCRLDEKLAPYFYLFFPLFPLITKMSMRVTEHPRPDDYKKVNVVSITFRKRER